MNLKYPLILASKSPRRQELLRQAGFEFSVQTKETNEEYPDDMAAVSVARYLAEKKAAAFLHEVDENTILLTSDTTVVVDEQVLGKPQNASEATDMLRMLSGRSHRVMSAASLLHQKNIISFEDSTEVFFRTLRESEISYYIENFEPYDKAGGYGIQEWIGMIGIEKIIGSYYTVMGLPIQKVYMHLVPYHSV